MKQASSAAEIVIEMKDLAVGYGQKKVLSGIRAQIWKGQFVSLLGPNGAGKTTLLRTITRHLRKLDGTLLLNNRPIETYRQKELAAILGRLGMRSVKDLVGRTDVLAHVDYTNPAETEGEWE